MRRGSQGADRGRAAAVSGALALALCAGFVGGWATRGTVDATPSNANQGTASAASRRVPFAASMTARCPAPTPIVNIAAPARVVALTFDDGPSVDTTDAILAILRQKQVKATFFETGEHTAAHPELVAKVAAAGHAVGSHSWNHPRLSTLTEADLTAQLESSTAAVADAIGQDVCLMRPPFGDANPSVDATIARLRLTKVGWTDNPIDWENPSAAELTRRVVAAADGHPMILLLHEHGKEDPQQVGPSPTVQALGDIVDGLKRAGYSFVQVDGRPFPTDPPPGRPR